MSASDFMALSPFIVGAAAVVAIMLGIAVRRNHAVTAAAAMAGLAVMMACIPLAAGAAPRQVTPLIVIDAYALFWLALILGAGMATAVLARDYLRERGGQPEEFYLLLLVSCIGAGAMVCSRHFASFYLSLEVMTIPLYGMISYLCTGKRGVEAGLKYLILAGAASAFLLFGVALVYSEAGTLDFVGMACATVDASGSLVVLAGLAMVLVGLGFKLSLAPFHLWTPDVYEGAPAPVTAFMATVSKGAVLAALLRYFSTTTPDTFLSLRDAFSVAAAASMLAGNLLALRQTNVKRVLACSSIAHAGYVAVAFLALGDIAVHAVAFYFAAYFAATLGAFGVVSALSASGAVRERDALEDYRGLFHTRPVLAGVLALMLLSLAGIPLTAGFLGKVYVFIAGIHAGLWWQTGVLVFASAVGLVYYLRIVAIMTAAPKDAEHASRAPQPAMGPAVKWLLAVLTLAVLWMGIYPAPLLRVIEGLHLSAL